jgi:hypothetical protein
MVKDATFRGDEEPRICWVATTADGREEVAGVVLSEGLPQALVEAQYVLSRGHTNTRYDVMFCDRRGRNLGRWSITSNMPGAV